MFRASQLLLSALLVCPSLSQEEIGDSCGKRGKCTSFDNCLAAVNEFKLHGLSGIDFCDEDEDIVCCEEPEFARISEKKCFEYFNYVFDEVYVPNANPRLPPVKKRTDKCPLSSPPYIVGGNVTRPHEYPHMAIIGDDSLLDIPYFFCDGFLISERFVLTAAHCKRAPFEGDTYALPKMVRLGSHNVTYKEPSALDVEVERFISHAAYSKPYNDIALIKLVQPVSLSTLIRPACLPSTIDAKLTKVLVATGWGATQYRGPSSDVLLKVELPRVSNQKCYEDFVSHNAGASFNQGILDSQICYGGVKGKDSCSGDSGGPLQTNSDKVYCSHVVYGVTSVGLGCGEALGAVYSNVLHYIDWVEKLVWPAAQ